jgi:hypothetical protein
MQFIFRLALTANRKNGHSPVTMGCKSLCLSASRGFNPLPPLPLIACIPISYCFGRRDFFCDAPVYPSISRNIRQQPKTIAIMVRLQYPKALHATMSLGGCCANSFDPALSNYRLCLRLCGAVPVPVSGNLAYQRELERLDACQGVFGWIKRKLKARNDLRFVTGTATLEDFEYAEDVRPISTENAAGKSCIRNMFSV